MLTSPSIFGDPKKLVLNPNDPWSQYIPNANNGGEILGASWMQRMYDHFESVVPGFDWNTHWVHPIIIMGIKQVWTDSDTCLSHGFFSRRHQARIQK